MDVIIEKMRPEDKSAVKEMMRDFYSSDAVITNGSDEIFENDIDMCTSDSPYAEGYVFKVGGEYSGYAMLAKSYSTEFGKPCIWIEDLYVLPLYRRSGIATRFFAMLFEKYKDGVVYRLEAEKENKAAMSAYEKCGFRSIGYNEMIKLNI